MVVSASCQQQQREKLLHQTANAIASASVKMEVEGDEGEDEEEGEVKVEVKAEPCDDDDSGDEEEDGVDEVNSKGTYWCYQTRRRPKVENFFHKKKNVLTDPLYLLSLKRSQLYSF